MTNLLEKDHLPKMVEYDGVEYDARHGGPFDRGSADCYYRRPREPHKYLGATYQSDRIGLLGLSDDEIQAYRAGYEYQHEVGDYKNYD